MRIGAVMKELKNEKIDVVEWSNETKRFVASALMPAKVKNVIVDEDGKRAVAIVPDNELSVAIGKEGINVRLASKLTGMKIDIKTVSDVKRMEKELGAENENVTEKKPQAKDILDNDALDDIMKEFEAVITDSSDNKTKKSGLGVDWDEDA